MSKLKPGSLGALKLENEQMQKYIGQLQAQLDNNSMNKLGMAIEFFKGLEKDAPRYEYIREVITSALVGEEVKEAAPEVSEFEQSVMKKV